MSKSYLDEDGLLYLWSKVTGKLAGKVDVVSGKQLSDNNYTTAEKNKLASLKTTIAWNDVTGKPDFSSVYNYKGSKPTKGDLPSSGNKVGDVWNVETDNMNYGWTGSAWDPLGSIVEIQSITNSQIDTITAG